MSDDRGDPRFSSFLVGFLVGSLLSGIAAAGYFHCQEKPFVPGAELGGTVLIDESRVLRAESPRKEMAGAEKCP